MSENLYEITGQMLELQEMAEEGDLNPQALEDTMESLGYDLVNKIDGYGKIIKNLLAESEVSKARAKTFEDEAKRYSNDADRKENNAKELKNRLMIAINRLHDAGLIPETKLAGDMFRYSVVHNGGKKPVVLDVSPESLPEAYRKVEYKRDDEAIRKFLDEHEGVAPFAHYGDTGTRLDIRMK